MPLITLQDLEKGEEFVIEVSDEEYTKITSGDYEPANKYLQREIERKHRLLAYRLALQKQDSNKQSENPNLMQDTADESINTEENHISIYHDYHHHDKTNMTEPESDSNSVSQHWSDQETKLLIELYRANFEKLRDRKYKAKLIYIEMAKHFDRFNLDQIESKIKNLKKTFKIVLDNSNKTGRGRITWPYFNKMQEILGDKPENNPLSIASSRAGFEQNSSEIINSDDSESDVYIAKVPKLDIATPATAGPSQINRTTNSSSSSKKGTKKTQPEPTWVKEFRTELAQQHKERMEKQQQFLDLFKQWLSKSKE